MNSHPHHKFSAHPAGLPAIPLLILSMLALMLAPSSTAADWPQWRGPTRDGHSTETNLLTHWPTNGPPLLWQNTNVGRGFSTPSIAHGQVYLLGNHGLTNEFALALSATDGHQLWSTHLGKVGKTNQQPNYPGARSTPTVNGSLLYALGSDGDLLCIETTNGRIRWRKQLVTDFAGHPGDWAYAESPLIDGDKLICTPGGAQATLLALNKLTGDVIWKSPFPDADDAGYGSAVLAEFSGVRQYVQLLAKGLVGVEAATGKLLWRYGRTVKGAPGTVLTPIVSDGCVFTSTAVGGGALLRPQLKDGQFNPEEVYYNPKFRFDMGGVIKVGDYLYGTAGALGMCLDFKTGQIKWELRTKSITWLAADRHLYGHEETGAVLLTEPTPDAYRELSRFTPPNRPTDRLDFTALTYPALADGHLYIREFESLWCYDVKAP